MKTAEFKRWLQRQGCTFDESAGKGSHIKVMYRGRSTFIPMHKGKEIKKGLMFGVLKQLGIKERP